MDELPVITEQQQSGRILIQSPNGLKSSLTQILREKLKDTKKWLYENRTMPVKEIIKSLNLKLILILA